MASWTFQCKWRSQEHKIPLAKTSKVKELKSAVAEKFGLDPNSVKLLLKGSSTHADSMRLCDISGLSSPAVVTVLSGTLTSVNVNDIDKKKYEEETQVIQSFLDQARQQPVKALSSSSVAQLTSTSPSLFQPNADMAPMADHRPSGQVKLQLPIFSGAMIPNGIPPSEFGNQVILPSNVLEQFTREEVPFPIVLELSRVDLTTGESFTTHVIPGEYQPRLNAVYAPHQVLKDLGLFDTAISQAAMQVDPSEASSSEPASSEPFPTRGEGSLISIRTTQLPPGTTATIQPLEFDWITMVAEEQQKPVLEEQLRRYLCLSLHDTIQISHQGRSFHFKVISLEPSAAVSLTSTDLAVDILSPMDAPVRSDLTPTLKFSSSTPSSSKTPIDDDAPVTSHTALTLKKGETSYFELELSDPNKSILFEVEALEGFPPTVYVCTRHQYPTSSDHTWNSDDITSFSDRQRKRLLQTGRRRILLSQDDPKFSTGHFYVAIRAQMADTSFVFHTSVGLKSELAGPFSSSSAGNLRASSGAEPPSDSTQCSHCHRWVPNASMTMHRLQCERLNWVCPTCQFVCPHSEKEKHISIAHEIVQCECGFESEGELVALHREFECHLRPFSCPFCNLSMPNTQRHSHMSTCGSRTSKCPSCSAWIKNNEMAAHQADSHPVVSANAPHD